MLSAEAEYLHAIGAKPIYIVHDATGFTYLVGNRKHRLRNIVSIHWVDSRLAAQIVRAAQSATGRHNQDRSKAERELQIAAHLFKVVLTPDLVARSRAKFNARKVRDSLVEMAESGQLQDFNREYKRRRDANGGHYIAYTVAMYRLRLCLIRRLVHRTPPTQTGLFAEVFGPRELDRSENGGTTSRAPAHTATAVSAVDQVPSDIVEPLRQEYRRRRKAGEIKPSIGYVDWVLDHVKAEAVA